jgi:biopolymer transport protein ExbB/TolQ
VAIPTYVAYNYLVNRVHNLVLDMEKAANEIVTFLARRDGGGAEEEPIVLTPKKSD